MRSALKSYKNTSQMSPTVPVYSTNSTDCSSCHSQDGSSITGKIMRFLGHLKILNLFEFFMVS